MTLIATTLNHSYPIILGDLLATSPSKKDDFVLPTFLEGVEKYLPDNLKGFPARLVQKTYIIKDNLVVAIAGNFLENKNFITSIKNYYKNQICTEKNINYFISQYGQSKFVDSAYLILFYEKKEGDIRMQSITIGECQSSDSQLFEKINAIGSGASDFITESKRYSNLEGYGNINDNNHALSANTILLSGLLAKEKFSLETIKKYWGAGFELITYDSIKERFNKHDEFTYIIWRGTLDLKAKDLQMSPYLVLSYKYANDILIISSSTGDKYQQFGILPIDMEKSDVDQSILTREFKIYDKNICSTCILKLSNGAVETPSFMLHKESSSSGPVTIEFTKDKCLEIKLSTQIINKLIEDLIKRNNLVK